MTSNNEMLVRACDRGDTAEIMRLLAIGANVNFVSPAGTTPLVSAVVPGNDDAVALLLANKANPNLLELGMTALMHAALTGRTRIVEMLLAHDADPTLCNPDTGETALIFAAENGLADIARMLLEKGARTDEALRSGKTVRQHAEAARQGGPEVLAVLREFDQRRQFAEEMRIATEKNIASCHGGVPDAFTVRRKPFQLRTSMAMAA